MTTITCKIPEQLAAELETMARRERVSKSKIVRQAIEQRVHRAGKARQVMAYDLVKHLCGVLHGPKDLSSNPQHMEGFGA